MAQFRASATVTWELEDSDVEAASKTANAFLNKVLDGQTFNVRVEKLKDKVNKVQLGEFKLEDVIPFITKRSDKKVYECGGEQFIVKMNSHRYFLFKDCTQCVACGLKGTRMFLEYHPADKSPHFNLYGEEDGKLILMTKDHIRARAFGGEDKHSNYQIMCIVCNNLKSHSNIDLEGVRLLRQIYNDNKDKPKKEMHIKIEEARSKIQKPWEKKESKKKKKPPMDFVSTTCDIFLYKADNNCLVGKSIFDPDERQYIACLKKGVVLQPLMETRSAVLCKIPESEEAILLNHGLLHHPERK